MGRRCKLTSSSSRSHFLPFRRSLLLRFIFAALVILLIQELRSFWIYQNALQTKYSRTDFGALESNMHARHVLGQKDIDALNIRNMILENRDQWVLLGSGREGKTFAFNNSVIKTFTPGRSPFRNLFPYNANKATCTKWPTEIPASILLGGSWDDKCHLNASIAKHEFKSGLLPVKSWFLATTDPDSSAEWHLVTPLVNGGSLSTLAKKVHSTTSISVQEIDNIFRPSFNQLLTALHNLHLKGFCHDDVKLGNIFIKNNTQWLLGDLGNLREVDHPYHNSPIWIDDNNQLPDCRANDAVRVIKTYLQFLAAATNDKRAFHEAFFAGREPWSRLFWASLEGSTSSTAETILVRSQDVEKPDNTPHWLSRFEREPPGLRNPVLRMWFGRERLVERAAEKILQTSLDERWARIRAWTWVFGVPISDC